MRYLNTAVGLVLTLTSPVLAQPENPPPRPVPGGQGGPTLPTSQELLRLVPIASTQNRNLRSFAFDVLHTTGAVEGMRTRGWYSGPGQLSLITLDERDNTPLLYLQGGKGMVYDAAAMRCLQFTYGNFGYNFGLQGKKALVMGLNMNPEHGKDRCDIDLRSLFPEDVTVVPLERGVYELTASGEECTASIRLALDLPESWGKFTLTDTKKTPHVPMVTIEIVDVNRDISAERLAFPGLKSCAEKLNLTAFPTDDAELIRCWESYLEGFKQKAPAELQAKIKEFDTARMKESQLALLLAFRSHFIRCGLRNTEMRARLAELRGDLPIVPADKKIDWDMLAASDKVISTALRTAFKQQTPLREPPSPAAREAEKLFEALAKKLTSARGFKVDYESKVITSMTLGNVQGTLQQAPGNRLKLTYTYADGTSLPGAQPAPPVDRVTLVSDGTKVVCHNGFKVTNTEVVNEKLDENLPGWLIRIGVFFGTSSHVCRGEDNDYRTLAMSDLKMVGKEKVDGRLANVISYTLTKGQASGAQHKLWIDIETGLPIKQTMETKDHFGFTETYRNWELQPKLPAETFTLPK